MRFLSTLLGVALGAGTLPGSAGEARDYAMREALSPEAQQFVGGDSITITVGGLLLFLLVVLVIIWIAKEI